MYRYRTFSTRTKHPVLTRPISHLYYPFSAPKFWSPDPFLWTDKRDNYHVLYHRMGAGVPSGWLGHHAWSRDGFTWSNTQPVYDNTFPIEGFPGTVAGIANGGAQRPKLLVQNGTATHLYVAGPMSGCPKCKGDYTLVSPLNV